MTDGAPVVIGDNIRPRYLYLAVFSWIAVTSGRFLAPFLEHTAGLDSTRIGALLALQQAVSVPCGSLAGIWADQLERTNPGRGRALVLAIGVVVGCILLMVHSFSSLYQSITLFRSFPWFVLLRTMCAISSSMIFPVLDGMCLEYVDRHSTKDDYGKERLYGALSWAVANLAMGPFLDKFGFVVLYPFSIIATSITVLCIWVYSNECAKANRQLRKRQSNVINDDSDGLEDTVVSSPRATTQDSSFITPANILCRTMLGSVSGAAFLLAFFTLASGQAVVDNLIFLFFEALGSSYTVMGVTVVLTVAFEIPIFHAAPDILQRFGPALLLVFAAVCYITRVIGYTFIPAGHASYVLWLEPLHGITYACSATASVAFVSQLTPTGHEATGQGLLSLFRGAGAVLGLWLGGWMIDAYGPRTMYRSSASLVLAGILAFGLVQLFFGPPRGDRVILYDCSTSTNTGHRSRIPVIQTEDDDVDDNLENHNYNIAANFQLHRKTARHCESLLELAETKGALTE